DERKLLSSSRWRNPAPCQLSPWGFSPRSFAVTSAPEHPIVEEENERQARKSGARLPRNPVPAQDWLSDESRPSAKGAGAPQAMAGDGSLCPAPRGRQGPRSLRPA